MADRRNLRDKAKSATKSVAGTLKQGAQNLKSKATAIAQDEETGITISEVEGQYLVIDSDGSAIGPYDDKMKAAAKARELKAEKQNGSQTRESGAEMMEGETNGSQGKVQKAATRFSEGVNRRLGVGGTEDSESSEPGKFQQYATKFSDSVNKTVSGDSGRTVTVRYKSEIGKWVVAGPTADFGTFDTKKPAVTKARQVYNSKEDYTGLQIETQEGAVQTDRSEGAVEGEDMSNSMGGLLGGGGDGAPELPFGTGGNDGDGPTLPFGGGESDGEPSLPFMESSDESGGPMLPGFDMGGDSGEPQFPGFGMGGDNNDSDVPDMAFGGGGDMGQLPFGDSGDTPQMPSFGMEGGDREDDADQDFPWF